MLILLLHYGEPFGTFMRDSS